ncbi:hypothetical protein I5S60_10920 [Pseudomonas fluorescens]|nr:hypothetical protein [Pseudomonas fluorescens]
MAGEQFQESSELQAAYSTWARQPGCTLLLLPPYKEGPILSALDWVVEFSTDHPVVLGADSAQNLVAQEVMYQLQGVDGSAGGGMYGDHRDHTRYWKAHSNSGLFAATMLPLWSISFLNHAHFVTEFLEDLNRHTGKASVPVVKDDQSENVFHPQDFTVMVCCYGFEVATAASLMDRLNRYAVPLLNLAHFDLPESINRLRQGGLLNQQGLTLAGLAFLQASKYWAFAENLKGEA